MTRFKVDDHVVVVNRGDKWDGLTGKIVEVLDRPYRSIGPSYRLKMDEPFSGPRSFTDGIHATFFDCHLDYYTAPVEVDEFEPVEDDTDNLDYEVSAHIVKTYMEDNRLQSLTDEEDLSTLVHEVLRADLERQGFSESACNDRALDLSTDILVYLDTIRPVLEAYWK